MGVLGTGVQVIQEVAKTVRQLFVFRRTPNWCAPLLNSKIDADTHKTIHATYDQIFKHCSETMGNFLYKNDPRSALEVSDEEREALFEKLYAAAEFGILRNVLTDHRPPTTDHRPACQRLRQRFHRAQDPCTRQRPQAFRETDAH